MHFVTDGEFWLPLKKIESECFSTDEDEVNFDFLCSVCAFGNGKPKPFISKYKLRLAFGH